MSTGATVKPSPGIPPTAKYHYDFQDRHVINDAFNKVILIQVLHDYTGALRISDYERIKAGLFWDMIPGHLLQDIKQAIDSGYRVEPAFINGYNTGNGFIVYQMHPIKSDSPLFQGKGYKP